MQLKAQDSPRFPYHLHLVDNVQYVNETVTCKMKYMGFYRHRTMGLLEILPPTTLILLGFLHILKASF